MAIKQRLWIVVGVAFVAAVLSTFAFYRWVSGRLETGLEPSGTTGSVVVASRDLLRGTQLTSRDLELASWSSGVLSPDIYTEERLLEGRFVSKLLRRGQPVAEAWLVSGDREGLAAGIPPGMRAVSLHVSEYAGVTQLLQAEDRVDIFVADGPPSPGNPRLRLRALLQNVEVLATGRAGAADRTAPAPVVTVLVEAKDSERLSLADQAGSIRLALRNPLDETISESPGQTLSDLLAPRKGALGSGG